MDFLTEAKAFFLYSSENDKIIKGKAIPVTGRERPQGFQMSKLPHFLDSRR
jgi:hypothetical protein